MRKCESVACKERMNEGERRERKRDKTQKRADEERIGYVSEEKEMFVQKHEDKQRGTVEVK